MTFFSQIPIAMDRFFTMLGSKEAPLGFRARDNVGILDLAGTMSVSNERALLQSTDPFDYLERNLPSIWEREPAFLVRKHIDSYNYAFRVYGSLMEVYTWDLSRVLGLRTSPPDPVSTLDDVIWANPHATLYLNPEMDRVRYLNGFDIRALTCVREYLVSEDPRYLVQGGKDTTRVMVELFRLGIVERSGPLYIPNRNRVGKRNTLSSNPIEILDWAPSFSLFRMLEKTKIPYVVGPTLPRVPCTESEGPPPAKASHKVLLVVTDRWMALKIPGSVLYGSREMLARLARGAFSIVEVYFIFGSTQEMLVGKMPHFVFKDTTRIGGCIRVLSGHLNNAALKYKYYVHIQ